MIPQEEIDILSNLTDTELAHLFSGLGVTEGQYMFKGRASPGQEQKFANSVIDTETGAAMEYRNMMKDYQHKKSGSTHFLMNWKVCHKAQEKYSRDWTPFSLSTITTPQVNSGNILYIAALW